MAAIFVPARCQRKKLKLYLQNEFRFKDIENPFDLNERTFKKHFRLTRAACKDLCDVLRPQMTPKLNGHSVEIQVLSSLQLLASGSFQYILSTSIFTQIPQSTLSRHFDKFLNGILELRGDSMSFPSDADSLFQIKNDFRDNTGFPNCVGAIDCTHVNITKPTEFDWFVFMNRKNDFSINAQMVCDFNMRIIDVVARWPGSTHDSFIWKQSGLREIFQTSIPQKNFLIGDSGYPLEPWLLTPYSKEDNPRRRKFNEVHRRARNVIERCFGVLKSRFRCLHETGGTLKYTPEKVCKIITVCAFLHNFCLKYKIELDAADLLDLEDDDDDTAPIQIQNLRRIGAFYRDQISINL